MKQIHVGVVGVGNCASSLVQGVCYYAQPSSRVGLSQPLCAGYAVSDLRFVSAFDVDVAKLGLDLSAAIWSPPNNAHKFSDVPVLGVSVQEGALEDGVGHSCAAEFSSRGDATVEQITDHLQRTRTRVLVNFLPTGSQRASDRSGWVRWASTMSFASLPATPLHG